MCNKKKFTKIEAKSALKSLIVSGRWNRKSDYGRIYCCSVCGFWHITSSEYFFTDEPQEELQLINESKFINYLKNQQ